MFGNLFETFTKYVPTNEILENDRRTEWNGEGRKNTCSPGNPGAGDGDDPATRHVRRPDDRRHGVVIPRARPADPVRSTPPGRQVPGRRPRGCCRRRSGGATAAGPRTRGGAKRRTTRARAGQMPLAPGAIVRESRRTGGSSRDPSPEIRRSSVGGRGPRQKRK